MKSESKDRVYQIDLLRFLAALSVVLYHYFFRGYMADNLSDLRFEEVGSYFKYGYLGVDMFFIISGFVITLSIKNRSLTDFCISRISRLYPSYWLGVLLTFLVITLFGTPRFSADFKQAVLNLSMFHNYFGVQNIDGVYWTLFVEMKFYIFVIGTYLILNRFKEIKLDYLIYIWLLLSIGYIFLDKLFIFKVANYFLVLGWSSYFVAGMIFYQIYTQKLSIKYFALLCIALSVSIFQAIARIKGLESLYNFSPFIVSGYIITFYSLMLLIACGKLKAINSPKLIKLGLLTYPLYLIHQNIGYIIFNKWGGELNKYVLVILTVVLMLFLSYLISEFYESRVSHYLKTKLKQLTTKKW
jgi:peptidoglycan/LPS O-acetylase OafA/YrhL